MERTNAGNFDCVGERKRKRGNFGWEILWTIVKEPWSLEEGC